MDSGVLDFGFLFSRAPLGMWYIQYTWYQYSFPDLRTEGTILGSMIGGAKIIQGVIVARGGHYLLTALLLLP